MKIFALLIILSANVFALGEKSQYGRNTEVDEECACNYCQDGIKPECRGTFYSRERVNGKTTASVKDKAGSKPSAVKGE